MAGKTNILKKVTKAVSKITGTDTDKKTKIKMSKKTKKKKTTKKKTSKKTSKKSTKKTTSKSKTKAKKKRKILPEINHILVPKHTKLNQKETQDLMEKYQITVKDLPKIKKDDPGIRHLKIKTGDVIKIERKSPTAGNTIYYRSVIK